MKFLIQKTENGKVLYVARQKNTSPFTLTNKRRSALFCDSKSFAKRKARILGEDFEVVAVR